MGQWQLATLDVDGCLFVMRYVLNAFRSRKPEDGFWIALGEFFGSDDLDMDPFERCFRFCASVTSRPKTGCSGGR